MELIPPVVSTHWLNTQLEQGNAADIVILDVTWFSDKDAMADFSRQHILGAVHFDPFVGTQQSPLYSRPLPDAQTFEISVRGATVSNSSHVIIYESCPGKYGFFVGGRVYMMFKLFGHNRVSVLDGGLEKWISDGYEVTSMCMRKMAGDFTVKPNNKWRVEYEDMVTNLTTQQYQVLDSRTGASFHGNLDDPKSGRYPGAINIPFSSLFNDVSNDLKKVDELREVFGDAGVHLDKPIVTMCNSGMSSCTLALAALLCGAQDVAEYFGGLNEWKAKADEGQIHRG